MHHEPAALISLPPCPAPRPPTFGAYLPTYTVSAQPGRGSPAGSPQPSVASAAAAAPATAPAAAAAAFVSGSSAGGSAGPPAAGSAALAAAAAPPSGAAVGPSPAVKAQSSTGAAAWRGAAACHQRRQLESSTPADHNEAAAVQRKRERHRGHRADQGRAKQHDSCFWRGPPAMKPSSSATNCTLSPGRKALTSAHSAA